MNRGLLSVLTVLAAVMVGADTGIVPQFRIGTGGYYRTNPKICTERHAIELKEAGVDFVADVEISNRSFLDHLHKHGLYAYALRAIGYWCGGNGSRAGKMPEVWPRATYEKQITDIRSHLDHPAIRGFMLADEPSSVDMEYIGEIAALLKKELPDKTVFVNLYPCYASVDENTSSQEKSQLGCATYEEHVETYCRTIPLDYISYDHYPYFEKDETTLSKLPRYYGNFKTVSDACHRTGRAFWMIPQVNSRIGTKPLSRNNLRFQAYAAMAFGAETLVWECWCPGWWTNNVYTAEGVKTEQYDKLKEVNLEIRRFAPDYMRFRNVATHFVGRWPNAEGFAKYGVAVQKRLDTGSFRGVKAEDESMLVVGEMVARRPEDRARALFVFAADDATDVKRATHRIRVRAISAKAKGVASNGTLRCAREDDGSLVFELSDNHCALLVVED